MSTNKDQYLESARKWVVKGQLDRAIKDYQQVVTLDPADMKHRQKLAELLVRVGRKVPAINEYDVIGRYYAENGYYLKAIAVYKQIQKLDPEDLTICLKLGEYNRKQGLTGNSLAEYGMVLDHYQQTGDLKEAFKVLEKMIEVDPDNLETLLKYSEARYAAGEWDDAYEDFSRLALLLLRRGETAGFNRICERIRSIYPDRPEFLVSVASAQVEAGEISKALPILQDILKQDKYNFPAWELLTRAYWKASDPVSCESAFKYMIHFFPKELYPREGLIQLAMENNKADDALALISAHLAAFLAQGEFSVPERLCESLLPLLAEPERLLPVMKKLYDASGAFEKYQAVLHRLAPEHADEPCPIPEEAEPGGDEPAQDTGVGCDTIGGQADALDDAEDGLWEDEIDLSMLEDLSDGFVDGAVLTDAEAVQMVAELEVSDEVAVAGEGEDVQEAAATIGLEDITPLDWFSLPVSGLPDGELPFGEEDLPDFADFSSAIDDLFTDDAPATAAVSHSKYSTDEVLSAFRKGLDEQIDPSDGETHFDLGIAYKEMGLFDDAVNEFERASRVNPARLVDCLTLQGICYREKGEAKAAEDSFKSALDITSATDEQRASAMYDLALLYESEGRGEEADALYRVVQKLAPDFRDVTAKMGCGLA